MIRSSGRDERGSGTVLTIAAIAVLVSLAMVLVIGGGYLLGWRKAANAADLAALSAATAAVSSGSGSASAGSSVGVTDTQSREICSAAAETARANGVRLAECAVRGVQPAVVVEVEVDFTVPPPVRGLPKHVLAKAWASSADPG